jgi:hypothetical protein
MHLEPELTRAVYFKIMKMIFLSFEKIKKNVHVSNDVYDKNAKS